MARLTSSYVVPLMTNDAQGQTHAKTGIQTKLFEAYNLIERLRGGMMIQTNG